MEHNKNILKEEEISTDILIVGAGAGGMMAAITAADLGKRVVICEKGNAKRSGGIPGGNDHFVCYIPEIHPPSVRENFIRERMNLMFVDRDVISKQLDKAYDVLKKWETWGINMKTNGHYEFTGHGWPGSSGKKGEPGKTDRIYLHFSDNQLCRKLEKQVEKREIVIMNRTMMTELLTDINGRVVGGIGISTREPKLYIFRAKSIILNPSLIEPNRLYPYPHIIGYSMAQPGTGEIIMMAYRVGAEVQNAEVALRQVSMRFGPWAGRGTWIGVARDTDGNPIGPPYLSKPDPEIGDPGLNADAVEHSWATGKGPVWMDPREISEEDARYMKWGFESEAMTSFLKWLGQNQIDIRKTRFEFIGMQPGTAIQVRVDANSKTRVEGLHVIPEGSLSMSASGGMIAGEEAARYSQNLVSLDIKKHQDKIINTKQRYEEILNREGQQFADWREAQWAIYQIMHTYALPPRRTENTLITGHNHLLRLRGLSRRILKANNMHDLYHCLEVMDLMDIAEMVLLAVKERKESRGMARRQDYVFTNPMLDKALVIALKDGKPAFRWADVRRTSG